MSKSLMFHYNGRRLKTWNPITGCYHYCIYCWARRLVEKRLKNITKKYAEGFKPKFHPQELSKRFKPGDFVFVCDVGDMFGRWVPEEWILKVLNHISKFPKTTFLLLTKNPERFFEFEDVLKRLHNIVLGATIETDFNLLYMEHRISNAPIPQRRIKAMAELGSKGFRIMLSIEPILDFSSLFSTIIAEIISPDFVYIGYDNYGNRLPEPPLIKTMELIRELREHGITVYTKTLRKAWFEK